MTTDYNYDRNRLVTAASGGVTASYNYDPFGRLDTVTALGKTLERYDYDGFDRIGEYTKLGDTGVTSTTSYAYDPLDRTTSKTTNPGGAGEKTTDYDYLGLTDQVLTETVAGQVAKSYQYSPWGQRLSHVTHKSGEVDEDAYYGYNPHTDVETLTDAAGDTKATYGYTAYGNNDAQFTGIDKPDPADPTKEPYNPYRYTAKRFDPTSGTYDMGFRDYQPGLNRFLSRDSYNGALADLNLATDPFTSNRYALAGGNPITRIELDGHMNAYPEYGGGGGGIPNDSADGGSDSEGGSGGGGGTSSAVEAFTGAVTAGRDTLVNAAAGAANATGDAVRSAEEMNRAAWSAVGILTGMAAQKASPLLAGPEPGSPEWLMFNMTPVGAEQVALESVLARAATARSATSALPRQIDATWAGLNKYKHGGPMAAIEHINYRHAYESGFTT